MDPATAAVVMVPLLRSLLARSGAVDEAANWLTRNESLVNDALDAAIGPSSRPVTKAAIGFLRWLGTRVSDEPAVAADTPPTVPALPLEKAEPLFAAMKIAAQVSRAEPGRLVEVGRRGARLLPPERRVMIGISHVGGEPVPLLLLRQHNAHAEALARQAGGSIRIRVVGQATNAPSERIEPPTVPSAEHRPGRSVSHQDGAAGTLGAYVSWTDEESGRPVRGFLGASHVMSWMSRAEIGDHIHSPGPPDADRNIRHRYGTLENARKLVHVDEAATVASVINDCDVALARLVRRCRPRNMVPGPDPQGPMVPVERALDENELRAYSGDAFLVGRTSRWSRGRFLGSDLSEFVVEMPDRREYVFANGIAIVESATPDTPFSRAGDSGGMVYGFEGNTCVALGFVIGSDGALTYISPAARCLRTMGAELIGD